MPKRRYHRCMGQICANERHFVRGLDAGNGSGKRKGPGILSVSRGLLEINTIHGEQYTGVWADVQAARAVAKTISATADEARKM